MSFSIAIPYDAPSPRDVLISHLPSKTPRRRRVVGAHFSSHWSNFSDNLTD